MLHSTSYRVGLTCLSKNPVTLRANVNLSSTPATRKTLDSGTHSYTLPSTTTQQLCLEACIAISLP